MLEYLIVSVLSFLGGFIQGIAGFGCAVIMMIGFPYAFGLTTGAGITATCATALDFSLMWKYRDKVVWKELILPVAIYMPISALFTIWSTKINQNLLKQCFGGFLLLLAIYYMISYWRKKEVQLNFTIGILFIALSGITSALFGISGPLTVLYYMSRLEDQKQFFATTQACFFFTSIYNLVMRIVAGIITVKHIPFIIAGSVCIVVGGIAGTKIAGKINVDKIKLTTYIMIGICGIANLF